MRASKGIKILSAAAAIVMVMATGAWAQNLPRIAVYVTGATEQGINKALATRILSALVNSGKYQAVERSDEFLDKLDSEHIKQRSGSIDNEQIKKLGTQFGVDFVCIADITPVLGSNQVSARVVNVETAEVIAMGDTESPLQTLAELNDASIIIVEMMFGVKVTVQPAQETMPAQQTKTKNVSDKKRGKPRIFEKEYSLEIGGNFSPYTVIDSRDILEEGYNGSTDVDVPADTVPFSGSGIGGGFYLRADIIYAEGIIDACFYDEWIRFNIGLLGKYPVGNDIITVFPLLGGMMAGYFISDTNDANGGGFGGLLMGGRIDVYITETAYLRSEYLYLLGAGSGMSFKIGGGIEYNLNEKGEYNMRLELLYNWTDGKTFRELALGRGEGVSQFGIATIKAQSIELRLGIGLKMAAKKVTGE